MISIDQQILQAFTTQLQQPGMHFIGMAHDGGCPAVFSQNTALCNCNPSLFSQTEQECIETLVQNRKQRRAAAKAASNSNGKGVK
jgi:hypothetical protein